MGLFKADLYRSFAIGFVLGGLALGAAMSQRPEQAVIPQAQAATVLPDQTLTAPAQLPAR
jgi:hypothetical protein